MPAEAKDKERYKRIHLQLEQLHKEMSILSKSKPDNPVNEFKLKVINEKLGDANSFLGKVYRPLDSFSLFDIESLPTNSDVVVLLSQYLSSLERWESVNIPKLTDLLGG